MSVYLEAVAQAREHRQDAETAFRNALALAHQHHSLREIAPHAGMTYSGVAWLLNAEKNDVNLGPPTMGDHEDAERRRRAYGTEEDQ